jgi:hypothetical protein
MWSNEVSTVLVAVALVLNVASFVFAQQIGHRLVMVVNLVMIVMLLAILTLNTPGGAHILEFLRFFASAQTAP